ncbi:MAG: hypothetical protein ACW99U_16910 [Candidatus Thorarchaeota archaeon]|jgi:hypothetical protein
MSGYVYLQGDIRKTSYKVEERGLFVFGFTSGVSTQIAAIDTIIAEKGNFSIVPDHSRVHFVGRIEKEKDIENMQAAVYRFIVDEIVAEKIVTRKAADESIDASTPKRA